MTSIDFKEVFRRDDDLGNVRAKFLSRVFGIFSEEIVRIWARQDQSKYEDLGRPTVRGSTLDFTLREKETKKIFVAEMKCEIEYQNFKYLVLNSATQLDHHKKPAFKALIEACSPDGWKPQEVTVSGKALDQVVDGAILIWGAVTDQGKAAVVNQKEECMLCAGATQPHYHFCDVLSIESICNDLLNWNCTEYIELLETRKEWCQEMLAGLAGGGRTC